MLLKPCYDKKLMNWLKPCKNQAWLEEFVESGEECVEIVDYTHKNANSCYSSFWESAKKFYPTEVRVAIANGRIFLIRRH